LRNRKNSFVEKSVESLWKTTVFHAFSGIFRIEKTCSGTSKGDKAKPLGVPLLILLTVCGKADNKRKIEKNKYSFSSVNQEKRMDRLERM